MAKFLSSFECPFLRGHSRAEPICACGTNGGRVGACIGSLGLFGFGLFDKGVEVLFIDNQGEGLTLAKYAVVHGFAVMGQGEGAVGGLAEGDGGVLEPVKVFV